ncbi:CsiV family protein [Marinobacterium sedimentorum]|uniref:CsiV family protein n=1 Tax=Marinobacterium sedimentorum TaxID=2927804 RepID=UPI0020C5FD74|nr:CsiV family protein [Marinobacterium sedimentorum]MCP8686887.1 peptidoglycan binding protein CsiV [Marinobacterium sedimentorum]
MRFHPTQSPLLTSLAFTLLTLLSLLARAESPVYKVEVLVFANQDPAALKEQAWHSLEIPRIAGAAELGNGGSGTYQRLPDNNLVLTAEKNRLARQQGFRTLFHSAWYQPVGNRDSSRPVHLRGGQLMPNGAYELDGYISIDRDTFLQVRPDLYYTRLQSAGNLQTATLDTPRRMEANEIHYLDNPLFGVLVLIQR